MLTDQEKIALQMLEGFPDLISCDMDKQSELIGNALDFADYFLAISRPDEDFDKQKVNKWNITNS